ncbi:hypothetical protein CJ030_MR7G013007 [Morella rubra]|uniref:Myb/SANT-like domain-containing protein n=1 Tax=Morella rubra TaxID=262757 RepID=A0A6A1V627_9ROSI|nr:hypothetical protein CJ030_MR7G013012 [Morella rubra]KAB1208136.1 hypothetical protein CJ030_MR7G013007 [Morella rubra]
MAIRQRFQCIVDIINHRYNDLNVMAEQVYGHNTDMESECHAFTRLLDTEGYLWDKESNVVLATEARWENYLVAHPFVAKFCNKGYEHYRELQRIFCDVDPIATAAPVRSTSGGVSGS